MQAEVTRINAHQIVRYLDAYAAVAGDLPEETGARVHAVLESAERQWTAATAHDGSVSDQAQAAAYAAAKVEFAKVVEEAQAMCREVWATFNIWTMAVGFIVLAWYEHWHDFFVLLLFIFFFFWGCFFGLGIFSISYFSYLFLIPLYLYMYIYMHSS